MSTRNSTTRRAVIVAAVVAFAVPTFFASGSVAADPSPLLASVSPNEEFLISLSNSDGTPVTHLDVGTYTVLVDDPATIHDFRLTGPGIDSTSGLEFVGKLTWTLTFKDGQYAYFCTPHRGLMNGHFSVGTGVAAKPPPTAVQTLHGTVGPGAKISLPRTAHAGKTKIVIRDLTAKDSFHLVGPGANRRTGVGFKGRVAWTVTLKVGRYLYRSDAHPKLKGALQVR
jgi:hypothetical protein